MRGRRDPVDFTGEKSGWHRSRGCFHLRPILLYLAIVLLCFWQCNVCTCSEEYSIQEKILDKRNPTAYEFNASINDVKATIKYVCGNTWPKDLSEDNATIQWHGGGPPDFIKYQNGLIRYPKPELYWKEDDADELARGIFNNPANENDAYIDNSRVRYGSKVYLMDNSPLFYIADYHIHLSAVTPRKTRLEIITYDPKVFVGADRWGGIHGTIPIGIVVKPTTIEEYQILLRIGKSLGENNMPPIQTPKSDAEIRSLKLKRY